VYGILAGIEQQAHSPLAVFLDTLDASKAALFERLTRSFDSELAAKAVALKIVNLSLAKYHYLHRSSTVLSGPPGLVVDPSNACNLACPGCVHSQQAKDLKMFDWSPGILSEHCFTAFLNRYGPGAIYATLCNYGEPLINPKTPQYVRMMKRCLIPTLISTNLSLARFDAEAYVESGLDYMVLSIDGATQSVYERFRKKGNLELVFANIRKLVEAKRRSRRSAPVLVWRLLAFEHNIHEIPLAMEKAREMGLDQFRVDLAFDIGWDDPSIRPAKIEPFLKTFSADGFKANAENWNPFPGELDQPAIDAAFAKNLRADPGRADAGAEATAPVNTRPESTCEWLYKNITMDSGGRILPCCCAPRPGADLEFAHFNSSAASLADPFNSDRHRLARLYFANPAEYERQRDAGAFGRGPYCARCEWEKTANPHDSQIRNYFTAASPTIFSQPSLDLLASW
jgi:MoaA/NifB/PqqE/SkfB family radical SAM enzyme